MEFWITYTLYGILDYMYIFIGGLSLLFCFKKLSISSLLIVYGNLKSLILKFKSILLSPVK